MSAGSGKVLGHDEQHHPNHAVLCGIRSKNCILWFLPGRFICRRLARFRNQRQEVDAYLEHTFVPMSWMCKKQNRSFSQQCSVLNFLRWTQVYVGMDYQLFNLKTASWKHYPVSQPRGILSVTFAKGSFRLNHIFTLFVFESTDHVPPNIPNSSHSTQLNLFEDSAAVIQIINKGRRPNLRHVTRTHRVDWDRLCERVNLDHSILINYVRTMDRLADILTKERFTTRQ